MPAFSEEAPIRRRCRQSSSAAAGRMRSFPLSGIQLQVTPKRRRHRMTWGPVILRRNPEAVERSEDLLDTHAKGIGAEPRVEAPSLIRLEISPSRTTQPPDRNSGTTLGTLRACMEEAFPLDGNPRLLIEESRETPTLATALRFRIT